MNAMLRGSILYAADMYYELKETELRQIERIEESYMRKVMKTTKGCPITNLYLELGQIPARYEIIKMRLLFLKYILEQPKESNLRKMLSLQLEKPSPGDWANTCLKDLKNINLQLTLEEIRTMSKKNYLKLLKEKIKTTSLQYLLKKRGSKGSEIEYSCIGMAEYLQPYNKYLTIEEKREIFEIRNRMVNIPANFKSKSEEKCKCGAVEDMSHIYECEIWSKNNQLKLEYNKIFHGNISEQILVYRKFRENLDSRNICVEQSHPCGQIDPRDK